MLFISLNYLLSFKISFLTLDLGRTSSGPLPALLTRHSPPQLMSELYHREFTLDILQTDSSGDNFGYRANGQVGTL